MGGRGSSGGGGGNGSRHEGSGGSGEYTRTYRSVSRGEVRTQNSRIEAAQKSKNERTKYEKEHGIAVKLADDGHTVVHLDDTKVENGSYDALVDGIKTDFKETKGSSNIVRYAKEAIRDQKAERVVFNFTSFSDKHQKEIDNLTKMGIHGYYYKPGDKRHHEF